MTACRCGKPTRDNRFICDTCTQALEQTLYEMQWLSDELDITLTRQRATTYDIGGRSAHHTIPYNEHAAETKRHLHEVLIAWVRYCRDEGMRDAVPPRDTLPSLARWLIPCIPALTLRDIAPDAVAEINDAAKQCRKVVFWKRRDQIYLGPCQESDQDEACPGDVYADTGQEVGHCTVCGQGVTVVVRKAELDRELLGRLYTAAEIAHMSVYLGLNVDRDRVRKAVNKWHSRKLIDRAGTSADGVPMFRYGDVRARLYATFGTKTNVGS